jgi:hypothetical protein
MIGVAVAGCWTGASPAIEKGSEGSGSTPAVSAPISLVTSFVVVEQCPDSKKLDPKLAHREIDELVGPCKKVPGGAAHFSATLIPGGRVELASPSGDPAAGVVPTCLLQNQGQLKHKLRLGQRCKFDVKLEERLAEPPY